MNGERAQRPVDVLNVTKVITTAGVAVTLSDQYDQYLVTVIGDDVYWRHGATPVITAGAVPLLHDTYLKDGLVKYPIWTGKVSIIMRTDNRDATVILEPWVAM